MRYGIGGTVTALCMAVATAASLQAQEDFRWSGPAEELRIRGIRGDVRAEPTSGDRVEVVAQRSGADAGRVRVEVVERAGTVTVCAVHGEPRPDRDPCDDGGSRRAEGDPIREARVDFVVRIPAGTLLDVAIVQGDVTALGLTSRVALATVSGDVRLSTTGGALASTVNGNVDATFRPGGERASNFSSVAGDVTLRLPDGAGARVRASTLSGTITTDFGLEREEASGRRGPARGPRIGRRVSGTIGAGGAALGATTVSGDVRILRAP